MADLQALIQEPGWNAYDTLQDGGQDPISKFNLHATTCDQFSVDTFSAPGAACDRSHEFALVVSIEPATRDREAPVVHAPRSVDGIARVDQDDISRSKIGTTQSSRIRSVFGECRQTMCASHHSFSSCRAMDADLSSSVIGGSSISSKFGVAIACFSFESVSHSSLVTIASRCLMRSMSFSCVETRS